MAKVANIDRTQTDVATLVHENFKNEVLPWFAHMSPVAGAFQRIGPKGYQLIGKKLVIARDYTYRGGFMGTSGYIPEPQTVDPVNLEFTPARCYVSGASDNFLEAIAVQPGAFEDLSDRLVEQMFDAGEIGVTRHIHGSSDAIVCLVTSRTSATVVVVEDGYGFDGTTPVMYLEPGMTMASLDSGSANAVLAVAKISSIDYDTSSTTATITFASTIEGSGTIAAGDKLVFATTNATTDAHFETEYQLAPLGLLDIVDPADSLTTYGGATEASYPRINPVRRASSDFGHVELMEFKTEVASRSTAPVTSQTHIMTMHPGLKLELAKELLPFQQQASLGRTLQGGWETVRIGDFDIVEDQYHIPSVVYLLCPEDLYVVDITGDLAIWGGDGSQFQRMTDYDGKQWFARWYGNRFAGRRNRMGALTGCSNPNFDRYSAIPT